jgi:hypothetical protein
MTFEQAHLQHAGNRACVAMQIFLNNVRRYRVPGSAAASYHGKVSVCGSIHEQTGNRSVGITNYCETPGQQRTHHIHFLLPANHDAHP